MTAAVSGKEHRYRSRARGLEPRVGLGDPGVLDYGKQCLTNYADVIRLGAMATPEKRRALKAQGALNTSPERVAAALFAEHPGFFDAEDRLQVRYEMLRAPAQGEMTVVEACRAFGVSRQTFYVLRRAFEARGLAGLAEGKRGRKGPLRASVEDVEFVRQQKAGQPGASGAELARRVFERFGVSLHRRTVERLVVPKSGPAPRRAG